MNVVYGLSRTTSSHKCLCLNQHLLRFLVIMNISLYCTSPKIAQLRAESQSFTLYCTPLLYSIDKPLLGWNTVYKLNLSLVRDYKNLSIAFSCNPEGFFASLIL